MAYEATVISTQKQIPVRDSALACRVCSCLVPQGDTFQAIDTWQGEYTIELPWMAERLLALHGAWKGEVMLDGVGYSIYVDSM